MGLRKTDTVYEWQLTDDELEIASQIGNADLKKILRREGVAIGRHTAAFTKLTARVRAERMLHQELAMLRAVKDQLVTVEQAEITITAQARQINQLERELEKERNNRVKELAAPAMALHSVPGEQD